MDYTGTNINIKPPLIEKIDIKNEYNAYLNNPGIVKNVESKAKINRTLQIEPEEFPQLEDVGNMEVGF